MKKISILILGVFFLAACSQSNENIVAEQENDEAVEEVIAVQPTNFLSMEVSGMMCEMGCGGTIRKALKKTNAVDAVKFDFIADRDINIAKISYDATKVSKEELAKIVSEISNGQYSVGEMSVEEYSSVDDSNGSASGSSSKTMSIESPLENLGLRLPNLLDLLNIL